MWPTPLNVLAVCSAHPRVIAAALHSAAPTEVCLCIEATVNQVNHQGGYSAQQPAEFRDRVHHIARQYRIPPHQVRLGGDHLGPLPWRHLPADQALALAAKTVVAYTQAGYQKLHLDAATPLADDYTSSLTSEIIARRTAQLCAAAEDAFASTGFTAAAAPLYVIGQDVPPAGGRASHHAAVVVTSPAAFEECIQTTRRIFEVQGLSAAWARVRAVVVNSGAEFGSEQVRPYNSVAMQPLAKAVQAQTELVLEGHSTDYQSSLALKQMVADGIRILKTGPCLTFALREALLALSHIESSLYPATEQSHLFDILETVMCQHPQYWQAYYSGTRQQQQLARRFSLLDRCRYYWHYSEVQHACNHLLANLTSTTIPQSLISQYLPDVLPAIQQGRLTCNPESLIQYRLQRTLKPYLKALRFKE